MKEWEKAESPSIYWYKKFKNYGRDQAGQGTSYKKISRLDHFYYDGLNLVPLVHGLPLKEALTVCKELYKNNIAKVTIEIAEDSVLRTKRDFSVTFAEQLSIISMCLRKNKEKMTQFHIFRWNNWTVHWNEPHEPC